MPDGRKALVIGLLGTGSVILTATLLFDLLAMILLGIVMLPYDPVRTDWMRMFTMSPIGILVGGAAASIGLWLNRKTQVLKFAA
jgi:hypothetical protein